jgi:hypothetical protein
MDNHQNPAGEGDLPVLSPEPPAENLPADAPPSTGLLVERLLRSMQHNIDENLTPEQKLARQGMLLDSLFTTMLLAVPQEGQPYDERFNLAVALIALELIQHRRDKY